MAGEEEKRILKQLEVQERIAQSIKDSTQSLESFADTQKKISKNYKELKLLSAKIAELEEKKFGLQDDQVELLQIEIEKLQQEEQLLIGINKELGRGRNLFKAIANETKNQAQTLTKKIVPALTDAFTQAFKLETAAMKIASSAGLSGVRFESMRSGIMNGAVSMGEFGYEMDQAVESQAALMEGTGRNIQLTQQQYKEIAQMARITGQLPTDITNMASGMIEFGLGVTQAVNMIGIVRDEAEQMGVNSAKVIKAFTGNLNLLNKLNFKGGIKALAKMTAFSEKFKLDMNSVASVADKVFRPEGAIEAAAQLQVLGGSLAQLGDPFRLMYMARNAPDELAESLTKAAVASATFNKQTGEFEVNALELDRLRQAAEALGMDYTELVKTAKTAAQVDFMGNLLKGKADDDQIDMLTGLADMGKNGKATITFLNPQGKFMTEELSNLTNDQIKLITKQETDRQKLLEQQTATETTFNSMVLMLKQSLIAFFIPLVDWFHSDGKSLILGLKDFVKSLSDGIKSLGQFLGPKGIMVVGIIGALATILGPAAFWMLKGRMMGRGFNAVTSKGPLGMMGGGKGGVGGVMGKSPDVGGATKGAAGAGKMGGALGSQATNMLAGAAAVLILSAALFVFAKSLQEFEKLKNGWATLGMAAVGLFVLIGAVAALGALGESGVGAVGVLMLMGIAASTVLLGAAVWLVAQGISVMVDSFTNMFSVVNADNIGPLLLLGPALIMTSLGIYALSASMLAMGIALANPFGLLGLMAFGTAVVGVGEAFNNVKPDSIVGAVNAVNSVDMEKLNALKDLSMWLGLLGTNLKVEFSELKVGGDIELSGAGGGKTSSEWIEDPLFVNRLKDLVLEYMEREKRGGFVQSNSN